MEILGAGRALLLAGHADGPLHLWFVLSDPDAATKRVVLVMVVTERNHTDKTCRLLPGVHPFVRHASNVDYGRAKFAPVGRLERALASGKARLQADMSADLLVKVRRGLLESSRTIHEVADYCRERFGDVSAEAPRDSARAPVDRLSTDRVDR